MADACAFCGSEILHGADRCPACLRGQPVRLPDENMGPSGLLKRPQPLAPGSLVFALGLALIVLGFWFAPMAVVGSALLAFAVFRLMAATFRRLPAL